MTAYLEYIYHFCKLVQFSVPIENKKIIQQRKKQAPRWVSIQAFIRSLEQCVRKYIPERDLEQTRLIEARLLKHDWYDKSNLTSCVVQVKENLQEELSIHLHFRKLEFC